MEKIITADRTETFLNLSVGESYHSQTGAVEEALKKYAIPCKIKELAKTGTLTILDMFFGLGYNSAMAIDVALQENPQCRIKVIGVEKDEEIVRRMQEVNPPIAFFSKYKRMKNNSLQEGNVSVTLLIGDAREVVKLLEDEHFDAIFFDPWSPKTQPEMWHQDLFAEMHRVMKTSAILATYSCARVVRGNMTKAGLFWDDGPTVGRRGPGTVATKWE
jgi:tRNA U34 5-methylaminomethyl-2-thiouridine-forming methyltransferase MnmC